VGRNRIKRYNMKELSIMKKAMLDKNMTLRELTKRTKLDMIRLNKMERDMCDDVMEGELEAIEEVLGCNLSYMFDPEYRQKAKENNDNENKYFENFTAAYKAVMKDGRREGIIECPVCHGNLGFQVHSNGHVWAKCETQGCLCWLQ
jgi:DNA-binding Xre family transcriptional regulator